MSQIQSLRISPKCCLATSSSMPSEESRIPKTSEIFNSTEIIPSTRTSLSILQTSTIIANMVETILLYIRKTRLRQIMLFSLCSP